MTNSIDDLEGGLTVAHILAKEYKRRAKNDTHNQLIWECAAEIAYELSDNLEHIIDEKLKRD